VRFLKPIVFQVNRFFPERQFLYRSQGRVRYISLSRNFQLAMSLLTLVVLIWGGVTWG